MAILSGRDLRDLARRTPAGVWRAGGHGLGDPAPRRQAAARRRRRRPTRVLAPLRAAARTPGVRLELKGPVAALHYRAAPDAEAACLAARRGRRRRRAGSRRTSPARWWSRSSPPTPTRARALRRLAARPPFAGRRPVMLGDDATDEDAIAAAQALGGLGVKVGPGATAARLRARDPAAVRAWLAREATA